MTRICSRHGVIEAAYCPTCGDRTITVPNTSNLGHSLQRAAITFLWVAALGFAGFFLVKFAISQHRNAEAAAESQMRLIESLPESWRFCYSALSRLNDYTLKVAALKSYAEDSKLKLAPLNHEQIELFMSLFGDSCWERNKTAAFAVLSKYAGSRQPSR